MLSCCVRPRDGWQGILMFRCLRLGGYGMQGYDRQGGRRSVGREVERQTEHVRSIASGKSTRLSTFSSKHHAQIRGASTCTKCRKADATSSTSVQVSPRKQHHRTPTEKQKFVYKPATRHNNGKRPPLSSIALFHIPALHIVKCNQVVIYKKPLSPSHIHPSSPSYSYNLPTTHPTIQKTCDSQITPHTPSAVPDSQ